ncbi:fibronectin type III domain-containing protein [Anaeromicropila populeti]|uniref:YD repeat-containing protein n=1 Tax=Anaeromicropila populeti TaxID=37658 RepID=A0A1I6LH38_9FIRM|nr:PKD domain-containing protein [Anaeromicropila populeti]SFS02769.1 YD repeat-containing protein [Anaeromicropila populeti]
MKYIKNKRKIATRVLSFGMAFLMAFAQPLDYVGIKGSDKKYEEPMPAQARLFESTISQITLSCVKTTSKAVTLQWESVIDGAESDYTYSVYRNNELIIENITDLTYEDTVSTAGNYLYKVEAKDTEGAVVCTSNEVSAVVYEELKITSNLTLTENMEVGDVIITSGSKLDLQGYRLMVHGDVTVNSGTIVVNRGYLLCEGNFKTDTNGYLNLTNPSDKITIAGNLSFGSSSSVLSAGVMEIGGNAEFTYYYGGFYPYNTFETILNGTTAQTVKFVNERSYFNVLTLNNPEGILVDGMLYYKSINRNGTNITYLTYDEGTFGWTLTEDETITGDLVLKGGDLDLNGHSLTITGDLVQYQGKVSPNNGTLTVQGDCYLATRLTAGETKTYGDSLGILEMINENDHVVVEGNFCCRTLSVNNLTNGLLEVKGDIDILSNPKAFSPGENHKILLSGTTIQTVNILRALADQNYISNLEITNQAGVVFKTPIPITHSLKTNGNTLEGKVRLLYTTKPENNVINADVIVDVETSLRSDIEINGELTINSKLYLYGHSLIVNGNVTISGTLTPENGSFSCDNMTETVYGRLNMTSANDYICVNHNLELNGYLSGYEGILEVKGDVTQIGASSSGVGCYSNSKMILSGTALQTISFDSMNCKLNIVEIQNENEGVFFKTAVNIATLITNGNICKYNNGESVGWTLNQDEVYEGDLYLISGELNLNGHVLEVQGNLIQGGGTVNINGGTLHVTGDYRIQSKSGDTYSSSSGILDMEQEEDRVHIQGSFIMQSTKSHVTYLTNGKLEVEKDIQGYFESAGSHITIVCGADSQSVTGPILQNLQVTNTSEGGVTLSSTVVKGMVEDGGKPIGGSLEIRYTTSFANNEYHGSIKLTQSYELTGDLKIYGDLLLISSYFAISLVLNNYNLIVNGSITATNANFDIGKGKLYCYGNMSLGITYSSSGNRGLKMTESEAYVFVQGNLTYGTYSWGYLTNGILEIKGNFSPSTYKFVATESHKTILSGSEKQTVSFGYLYSTFNKLEIQNAKGVYFENEIRANELIDNGHPITSKSGGEESRLGWTLTQDETIEGDLYLIGGTLDLNGHKLSIKGTLIQSSGIVKINGGQLIVEEDYRIQRKISDTAYSGSYGVLVMQNANDYVEVRGDFYADGMKQSGLLTAGTFCAKGDFISGSIWGNSSFTPTESFLVRFNGTERQNINCSTNTTLLFQNVELENENVYFEKMYVAGKINDYGREVKGLIYPLTGFEAENNLLHGSLYVMSTVTLTQDLEVTGDLKVHSYLGLSGCSLTVNGSVEITSNMDFIKGRLYCKGNFSTTGYGGLYMGNAEDYLLVEGNTVFGGYQRYGGSRVVVLTNGVMELKGDFTQVYHNSSSDFQAANNHSVIFSGDGLQTITIASINSYFNKVVINKKYPNGIMAMQPIYCNQLIDNGYEITYAHNGMFGTKLEEDMVIGGDYHLVGGELDLNGHTLEIQGNFYQSAGTVLVNGGKLLVQGDYRIQEYTVDSENNKVFSDSKGILNMTKPEDYVLVQGDFVTESVKDHTAYLTNGILEVKGNFSEEASSGYNFNTSDQHKTIFSGDKLQTVYFYSSGRTASHFQNLEINNVSEEGVNFRSLVYVNGQASQINGRVSGSELYIASLNNLNGTVWRGSVVLYSNVKLTADYTIEGSLSAMYQADLNGFSLSVQNYIQSGGTLYINGGKLYCTNNFTYYGYFKMDHTADYVFVGNIFTSSTNYNQTGYLTDGVLEVQGDFMQTTSNGTAFVASGNHETILSGKPTSWGTYYVQMVSFKNTANHFNKLTLTRNVNDTYSFSADVHSLCNILNEEMQDAEAPSKVTGVLVNSISVNSVQLSWAAATDNEMVTGYIIYRNGTEVARTSVTYFKDMSLKPNTTYRYTIYAFDAKKNLSEPSEEVYAATLKDEESPTVPSGLEIQSATGSSITLVWSYAQDNTGVAGYEVFRDGAYYKTVTSNNVFKDTDVQKETSYEYQVRAFDTSGNYSELSTSVTGNILDPSINSTLPEDGQRIGGDAVTLQVLFQKAGTGNKVTFEYCGLDQVWYDIVQVPIGQQEYNDSFYYAKATWNIKYLASGNYTVRYTLYDIEGNTSVKEVIYEIDKSGPDTPSGVSASSDNGTVTVSWEDSASEDCVSYEIYRAEENAEEYHLIGTVTKQEGTSFLDRTCIVGQTYSYKIRGMDDFTQTGEFSEAVFATVAADLEAPSITAITPNGGKVSGWVDVCVVAQDNILVKSIDLYYVASDQPDFIKIGTIETSGKAYFKWDTTGIADGTYYIKAVATDISGNTAERSMGIFVLDNTGIAKIQIQEVTATSNNVLLKWADVEEDDFAYFMVEQKFGDVFTSVGTVSDTLGMYVQNLKANTEYTFRVVGYDKTGNRGTPSEEVAITTSADESVPVIKGIYPVSSYYKNKIQLGARVIDNCGCDRVVFSFSKDKVEWTELAAVEAQNGETDTTLYYDWDISQLDEGDIYVKFEAYDLAGNKNALINGEEIISLYKIDRTAPEPVSEFHVTGQDGYVALTWNSSTETDISSYHIYRKQSENGEYSLLKENCTSKNYYDTDVEYEGVYYYCISAVDIAGNEGARSEEVVATVQADGQAPAIRSFSPSNGTSVGENPSISILALDNSCLGSILLEYKGETEGSEGWNVIASSTVDGKSYLLKTTWMTEQLSDGLYDFRVKVTDKNGNQSDYVTYQYSLDTDASSAPEVILTPKDYCMELSWAKLEENDFAYFEIYRKVESEENYSCIKKGTGTSYDDWEVTPNISYSYKVCFYDSCRNCSESNVVEGIPLDNDVIKPVASIAENLSGIVGMELGFDGTASTDNVGIVKYKWDMGDGTILYGSQPVYTYDKDGVYSVTLTVEDEKGNQASASTSVTIYPAEDAGSAKVRVVDESNNPIPYAYFCIQLLGGETETYRADYSGYVKLSVESGTYKVAAYKQGYLPKEDLLTITPESHVKMSITLQSGDLVVGDLTWHRMEIQEMLEAGVDLSDPENYDSFSFSVTLTFAQQPLPVEYEFQVIGQTVNVIEDTSETDKPKEDKQTVIETLHVERVKKPSSNAGDGEEDVPILVYLHTSAGISWLKDIYAVELGVLNNASANFSILNANATLELPDGVSFAGTKQEQTLKQDMGTIYGQQRESVSWYVKGDKSGSYQLSAAFNGTLMPFNIPVSANFKSDYNLEIEESGKGLVLSIMPQASAYINEQYYVQYQLKNDSGKTYYNLKTTFGNYASPGSKSQVIVFPKEGQTPEVYEDEVPATYHINSVNQSRSIPIVYEGETIEIGVFEPGDVIYGTYKTAFTADGDPDEVYYDLVDTAVESWGANKGIKVEVHEIPSHISKSIKKVIAESNTWADPVDYSTGAYLDSYEALALQGLTTISLDLEYNSMITDNKGQLGYGWSHNYETFLKEKDGMVELYWSPSSNITFIPENAINRTVHGVIIDSTIMLEEADAEGAVTFGCISAGMSKYKLERSESGTYTLYGPNRDVFQFNQDGKLTKITDAQNRSVLFEQLEQQTIVTEPVSGKRLIMNYNSQGLITEVSDDYGRKTSFAYTDQYLTSITNPLGETTTYAYENGKIVTVTNSENCTYMTNTYDESGRVLTQDDADANTPLTYFSYEDNGQWGSTVVTITDRNGKVIKVKTNYADLVEMKMDQNGSTSYFQYDWNGNLVSEKDGEGNTTYYEYDSENRRTVVRDAFLKETHMSYDSNGNVIQITGSDGSVSTYEYNEQNLQTKVTDQLGLQTQFKYNENGQLLEQKVEGKGVKYFSYEKGMLVAEKDYLGNETTYTYDDFGNVKTVKDKEGNRTEYTYDTLNRVIEEKDAAGGIVSTTYDCFGNQTTRTDARGNTTTFAYANNLLTKERYADGCELTYEYDGEGRTTKAINPDGTALSTEYDAAGNVVKTTAADNTSLTYTYDHTNQVTTIMNSEGAITRFEYYPNGKLHRKIFPDETYELYTYNDVWKLASVKDGLGHTTSYEYDKAGHLISEKDPLGNTWSYEYNLFGELMKTVDANGNETTYEYDANGNCILNRL